MTRGDLFTNVPPRKKITRIENYLSQVVVCSDGGKGLKCMFKSFHSSICQSSFLLAFFIYHEDPRSKIPKAVWTWAAKVSSSHWII